MGQYYIVANLDKKEYLNPHDMDDGAKLMEFASGDTMQALAILCSFGNGRGGGDFRPVNDEDAAQVGRWAGDRIVIAGDYADNGAPGFSADVSLYELVETESWKNIAPLMLEIVTRAQETVGRRYARAVEEGVRQERERAERERQENTRHNPET